MTAPIRPLFLFELAGVIDEHGKIEPGFGLMTALAMNPHVDVSIWSSVYPDTRRDEFMFRLGEHGVRFPGDGPLGRMSDAGVDAKREWVLTMPFYDRARMIAVYEPDEIVRAMLHAYGIVWFTGPIISTATVH